MEKSEADKVFMVHRFFSAVYKPYKYKESQKHGTKSEGS